MRATPYGDAVDVYIISNSTSGEFSDDQIIAIEDALVNWDNTTASGITWTVQVVSTAPTLSDPYVTVQFGSSCAGDACATTTPDPVTGQTDHSVVAISPSFTAPFDALMAHEIGHTYGFDDCTAIDCDPTVTIMYDNPITVTSHTLPVCCDKKRLYTMTSGDYGQYDPCAPVAIQGRAYLDVDDASWARNSVTATFDTRPDPGNSIVVGCINANYKGSDVTITDSSGNSYVSLVSGSIGFGYAPVALFSASQIQSDYPLSVTCTLPGTAQDIMNIFALEVSGLSTTLTAVDATGSAGWGGVGITSPLACASLTTTATNDLVVSLFNSFTSDSPASVSPTSGSFPTCSGGDGSVCAALDGSIYEVSALAIFLASSTGTQTPGFNAPTGDEAACSAVTIKALGQ
jgi:hypothetical protein